ncbi:MAG: bifunctional metallophosphatase/5'-nucleotidase [bacterium]|nr:bifunctional metallophosphatase/5'-nucleotidase [bacterium]
MNIGNIGSMTSIYTQPVNAQPVHAEKAETEAQAQINDGFARSAEAKPSDDMKQLRSAMLRQSSSVEASDVSEVSKTPGEMTAERAMETAFSAAASMVPGPSGAGLVPIRILFTNDIHGAVLPSEDNKNPGNMKGGLTHLATAIKEKSAETGSIVLDGGDWAQGSYIGGMDKGETVMKVLNQLGYDATVVGNHDFDWGLNALGNMLDTANFPVLGANIVDDKGNMLPGTEAYMMKEINGVKVGVIGIGSEKTANDTSAENTVGIHFNDAAKTVTKYKAELEKQGAQMVVVLSHNGPEADAEMAKHVSGVDVIVSAHSHAVMNPPKVVGDTLIVQAGSKGFNLGQLDLQYNPKTDKVVSYESKMNPINDKNYGKDAGVEQVLEPIMVEVNKVMGEVVGKTDITLTRRGKFPETLMGDVITDAMRNAVGADVAFTNSGGIRDEIKAGPITYGDVFKVLPFDNGLVTMELTGKQLKGVMEESAGRSRGTIEVSGMKMDIDPRKSKGNRCSNIMVNGEPLDLNKTYKVATADFLAGGSNGYTDLTHGKNVKDENIIIREALKDYMIQHGPFTEANTHAGERQHYLAPMPSGR